MCIRDRCSCFASFFSTPNYILFHAGSERGDPATVAVELTAHDQLLSHIDDEGVCGKWEGEDWRKRTILHKDVSLESRNPNCSPTLLQKESVR